MFVISPFCIPIHFNWLGNSVARAFGLKLIQLIKEGKTSSRHFT